MNNQQEYAQFIVKFLKSVRDMNVDFNNLSLENQQRFVKEVNAVLMGCGGAMAIENFVRKYI